MATDLSLQLSCLTSGVQSNFIVWLCIVRVADSAWDMRRERILKAEIIRLCLKLAITDFLSHPLAKGFQEGFCEESNSWECEPTSRAATTALLAKKGHTPDALLAEAYMRGADKIEANDRRFALSDPPPCDRWIAESSGVTMASAKQIACEP